MLKKIGIAFLFIILCPLLAGVYGIIHDQLTYSISAEYFTKFKFEQFGINDYVKESPRLGAVYVGWMATWWTGIPIGLILGLVGLIHRNWKATFQITFQSILLTIGITLATGLIGLLYGWLYLSHQPVDWWLPDNLVNRANFIMVGSMHNFSYLGGLIGLISSIIYQVRKRKRATTGGNTIPAVNQPFQSA